MTTIALKVATASAWSETVLCDFNAFLADHAACERKASGMAMSMLLHYPDKLELVRAMTDLALEEMMHFKQVMQLILARQLTCPADQKDPYVNALRKTIRDGKEDYFLDRLLVAGIIEARGAERFGLVAEVLTDPKLRDFYQTIATSESRHQSLFINLAGRYFATEVIQHRLEQLLVTEAAIVSALPLRAALH